MNIVQKIITVRRNSPPTRTQCHVLLGRVSPSPFRICLIKIMKTKIRSISRYP